MDLSVRGGLATSGDAEGLVEGPGDGAGREMIRRCAIRSASELRNELLLNGLLGEVDLMLSVPIRLPMRSVPLRPEPVLGEEPGTRSNDELGRCGLMVLPKFGELVMPLLGAEGLIIGRDGLIDRLGRLGVIEGLGRLGDTDLLDPIRLDMEPRLNVLERDPDWIPMDERLRLMDGARLIDGARLGDDRKPDDLLLDMPLSADPRLTDDIDRLGDGREIELLRRDNWP